MSIFSERHAGKMKRPTLEGELSGLEFDAHVVGRCLKEAEKVGLYAQVLNAFLDVSRAGQRACLNCRKLQRACRDEQGSLLQVCSSIKQEAGESVRLECVV